jgi:hypothetical protein
VAIIEIISVVGPILAVLVGVGLRKRDRREAGGVLIAVGAVAALILLAFGQARPLVGLLAALGFTGGIIADERGKRGWGLTGVSVGFFALIIAVMYT